MRTHLRPQLRRRLVAIAALGVLAIGGVVGGVLAARHRTFPSTLFPHPLATPAHGTSGGSTAGSSGPDSGRQRADPSIYERVALRGDRLPEPGRTAGATATTEAQPGLTLLFSADAPEARLIDESGTAQHIWWLAFDDVVRWTGDSHWGPAWPPEHLGRAFFRDGKLGPDGSLLVLFESLGLVRIDVNSKVQWASCEGQMHDSFDVGADGTIYALSRQIVHRRLGLETFEAHHDRLLDNEIVVLAADGRAVARFSLLDAFLDSDHATLLEWTKDANPLDASHLHVARHGLFRGQLVVCLRQLHSIAIVDPVARRVTAVFAGLVDRPSAASVVPGGGILALDGGHGTDTGSVVEFDPPSQRIVWRYPGPDAPRLRTSSAGTCQRLRNGNTLITESAAGRVIEVTPAGDVAWDYRSPWRVGEYVAALLRAERIDPRSIAFTLRPPRR